MAFTLIGSGLLWDGGGGVDSGGYDTTGADLIVVVTCGDGAFTFTDSKGNSYTAGSYYTPDASETYTRISYVYNPTTGSTTWNKSQSYTTMAIMAFGGAGASPLDQSTGNNGSTSTASVNSAGGNVTPTEDNELVVCGAGLHHATAVSSPALSVGTLQLTKVDNGGKYNLLAGYQIQTTATAVNPQFSWTTSTKASAAIMTFKSAAAAGQPGSRRLGGIRFGRPGGMPGVNVFKDRFAFDAKRRIFLPSWNRAAA